MLDPRRALPVLVLLGAGLASCRKPAPLMQPMVVLLPSEATLSCGHGLRFVPQLSGGSAYPVTWRVVEAGGGAVAPDGTYTAPASPGLYSLQAWESGPRRAQGLARIRVVPRPDGTIRVPDYVRVGARGLRAEVPPQEGSTYRWSITGGTLSPPLDGPAVTFEAGLVPHVVLRCRVTNVAGDSVDSSMDIETSPEPQVKIRPERVVLSTGEGFKFGFELSGRLEAPLCWRVVGEGGGTIDQAGGYQAPGTPGTFHVETSVSPEKSGSQAEVRVVERPRGRIECPGDPVAGATGMKACVPGQADMSYRWKVTGGSILLGQGEPCLRFSVGPGPTLSLVCLVTNAAGASLELTRTLPVRLPDTGPVQAPTP